MNFLFGLRDVVREELSLLLRIYYKCCRICKVYGFWGDLEDGFLYLVCERLNGAVLDQMDCFDDGLSKDYFRSFAVIGMEICEAMIGLHLEGLFMGCLSLACFELDDFGHVNLNVIEVLLIERMVHETIMKAGSDGRRIGNKEMGVLVSELFKREIFVSPELLFEMLKKENIKTDCGGSFRYPVVHSSDVWSVACIFLRLLIGKQFFRGLVEYVNNSISKVTEENNLDC